MYSISSNEAHMSNLHIPEYRDFLSAETLQQALANSEFVSAIPDRMIAKGLQADFPDIETPEALQLVCEICEAMAPKLPKVLAQRLIDRAFLDRETQTCVERNTAQNRDFHSPTTKRSSDAVTRRGAWW